jgi:hypothetical protein
MSIESIWLRLRHDDLDDFTALTHGATTASTGHDWVVATATTVARVAVEEVVVSALFAALHAVLALEDAGLHVGCALGALGGDLATVHVDVAGNIESTLGTEGGLPPGVVNTTEHGKLGARVDRSASSRSVLLEGDVDRLAGLETDRDLGLHLVNAHVLEVVGPPAEEDGVLAGVVGELGPPLAVLAEPDTILVALGVLSDLGTEASDHGLEAVQGVLDNVTNIVEEVAKWVLLSWGWFRGLARSLGSWRRAGGLGGRVDCLGLSDLSLWLGWLGWLRSCLGSRLSKDLVPVDVAEVVGNLAPVDLVISAALGLGLAASVEAGMAVVEVGGGGLTNNNGAQHQGGRVTHFE